MLAETWLAFAVRSVATDTVETLLRVDQQSLPSLLGGRSGSFKQINTRVTQGGLEFATNTVSWFWRAGVEEQDRSENV